MKRLALFFATLALLSLACSLPFTAQAPDRPADQNPPPTPSSGGLPPAPTLTAAPPPPTATVLPASLPDEPGGLHFVIPDGLAAGVSSEIIARAEGDQVAPWEIAPEHSVLTFTGYTPQNSFQKPQIYVYPVQDYLALNPELANTIQEIQTAVANPGALTPEGMPGIPFFNASQMFAAHMQTLNFQNGSGVRLVTQYSQALVPINNNELFYQFQGLSSDGKYYIIAILPITAPMLAADGKPESPVPADGLPFNYNDPNFDFSTYVYTLSS